ncbi:UNVERIFIED_CONTAM: hypothetical protein RMT77_000113 [Armadillidium vulgare]
MHTRLCMCYIILWIYLFVNEDEALNSKNFSSTRSNDLYKMAEKPNHTEDKGGGENHSEINAPLLSSEEKNDGNGFLAGRVITEVKIHPNGSALSVGNEHWDNIVSKLLSQKNVTNVSKMYQHETNDIGEKNNFTCYKCDDFYCDNSEFCYDAAQCFQARRRDSTGTETYSRGCIANVEQIGFICLSSFHMQVDALGIKCCEGNFCNNETYPILPSPSADSVYDKKHEALKIALYILSLIIILLILLIIIYVVTPYIFKPKRWFYKASPNVAALNSLTHPCGIDCKLASGERSMLASSGSGAGHPHFSQRTLAKNIYLEDLIGKGRYSEVYKGVWHGEIVAVKIFSSRDKDSWSRETKIYSILLRHSNILCFYGSDETCRASSTQLWLVTHYHPYGSLSNYLRTHVLDHTDLFNICLSIANGLLHLHTEIMGTQGKPAIAHRDLNSNNVLVKNDGTCCISDFGLSVVRTPGTEEIDLGTCDRSGTLRYMSPEMLDGSIDMDNFEAFRKADIYALALVMWEACQRCLCNGIAEEYSRPYENIFKSEPSYDEVRRYVSLQGGRPPIPNRWADDKVLHSLERLLNECWHQNPDVRLSTLRIKKNLLKITFDTPKTDLINTAKIV